MTGRIVRRRAHLSAFATAVLALLAFTAAIPTARAQQAVEAIATGLLCAWLTAAQRLRAERGRLSTISTSSPILNSLASSWAMNFFERVMNLP